MSTKEQTAAIEELERLLREHRVEGELAERLRSLFGPPVEPEQSSTRSRERFPPTRDGRGLAPHPARNAQQITPPARPPGAQPNPPPAPTANRNNFSLSALARALSASRSRHRSRISGSCSSASNSMPLFSAPTGESRSWQRREQRRLASSMAFICC